MRKSLQRYEAVAYIPFVYLVLSTMCSVLYTVIYGAIKLKTVVNPVDSVSAPAIARLGGAVVLSLFLIYLVNLVKRHYGVRLHSLVEPYKKSVVVFDVICYGLALVIVLRCMLLAQVETKPLLLNLYFFAVYAGSTYTSDKRLSITRGPVKICALLKPRRLLANALGIVVLIAFVAYRYSSTKLPEIFEAKNIVETAVSFYVGLFCIEISDLIKRASQSFFSVLGESQK